VAGNGGKGDEPLPPGARAARLAAQCASIGRDPATIVRILLIGEPAERPLASVAAFTDFAGRHAECGFDEIVFHHPRPDDPVWTDDPRIVDTIAAELF
jgi:hypothetical protein